MATVVDSTALIVCLVILSVVLAVLLLGLIALGILLCVRCRKARKADDQHVSAQRPQSQPYAYAQPPAGPVPRQQPQPQPQAQRLGPAAPKPQAGVKAPPPSQPSNQYQQQVKAGVEPTSFNPSFKDASFKDPSSPSGRSATSGASRSAIKDELGIKTNEYDPFTLDGKQGDLSVGQHQYSNGEGMQGFAWMQSGSGPGASGPSGPGASGSANYSAAAEARVPPREYTLPTDGTVNYSYEGMGTATAGGAEEEGASYDPTYDKAHSFHPRPNPDAGTANDNI